MSANDPDRVRLDKWLWAARFYKTRALAAEAIDGGKVHVNGERAKRSKLLQLGDDVRLRQGTYEYRLTVRGMSERRGPAKVAVTLYEEDAASRAARERMAEQLAAMPAPFQVEKGRPTKKDRRELERFRRSMDGDDEE
ncbi:MAG TPA: S4 domain-containing protein [Gemmatimonadales bacterium]|nr:S4 domain-containing protein [Gemmatimonadales bacterium]